jgi:drug/metabolite transporter (DMT)-like permease
MEINGQLVALGTALCWTLTALFFEAAGRRIGSLALNLLRLLLGLVMLCFYTLVRFGSPLPLQAPLSVWGWLLLSGLSGLALGDLFLFRAFTLIGARRSMLIYASVPVITTVLGMVLLGEYPHGIAVFGMFLTMGGIALVVLFKPGKREDDKPVSAAGIACAFGGALGQAVGLILTKQGMPASMDPFSANQIRSIGGILGLAAAFFIMKRWHKMAESFHHPRALVMMSGGAFFGPFLGVSLSLLALQLTTAGIASTIMSIVPVLIIPFSVFLFREKVRFLEVLGAFIAIGGVALQFLK